MSVFVIPCRRGRHELIITPLQPFNSPVLSLGHWSDPIKAGKKLYEIGVRTPPLPSLSRSYMNLLTPPVITPIWSSEVSPALLWRWPVIRGVNPSISMTSRVSWINKSSRVTRAPLGLATMAAASDEDWLARVWFDVDLTQWRTWKGALVKVIIMVEVDPIAMRRSCGRQPRGRPDVKLKRRKRN